MAGGSKGSHYHPKPCKAFLDSGVKLLSKEEELAEKLAPLVGEHMEGIISALVKDTVAELVEEAVAKALESADMKRPRDEDAPWSHGEDEPPARNLRPRKAKSQLGSPEVKLVGLREAAATQGELDVEIRSCRADGHCGFRAASMGLYGGEDKWLSVRAALFSQLDNNKEVYKRILNWTDADVERTSSRLQWDRGSERAGEEQWFDAEDCGALLADLTNRPVLIYDKRQGCAHLVPPSLSSPAAPQSALSVADFMAIKVPVIALQFSVDHWDFISKIAGRHALPATPQWAQLQKKEGEGGIRTTWLPVLDEIRAKVVAGLDMFAGHRDATRRAKNNT
ncbi:WW domain-binding protein 11 [Tilletia horrida]|nr:WW domain-binding protein 11 [Tilletia horrida]